MNMEKEDGRATAREEKKVRGVIIPEMVERVAKAMAVADERDPKELKAIGALRDLTGREENEWVPYLIRAEAAIAAMREPTEAMLLAGEAADEGPEDRASPLWHWHYMIDAALTGQ